jgi:hypothetical protein
MDLFSELINNGDSIRGQQCYINISLDGEIDFSPLDNKNLEEIHFVDGTISRIYNIPRGIKKIVINNNKLEKIPHLELRDLVHLEANQNILTNVDLTDMVNLVLIQLNDNEIRKISNLPSSLETLFIDDNDLEELDLSSADSCTNVSCRNNPRLYEIIGGKQMNNSIFNLNKDPHTQIIFEKRTIKRNSLKEDVEITDVKQAVNEYYALKNQYENNNKDMIQKIMNGIGSRKVKIQKVRNAIFKCVNCGKNGGSIFKKIENNLSATCGNIQNPCNLNIDILSSLTLSDADILETKKIIDLAKQNIIQTKMNMLFGYIEESKSISEFKKNIEIIKTNNMLPDDLINNVNESYYNMQFDTTKMNIISKKMKDVYSELAEIQKHMQQYEIDKNQKILEDVALKQQKIQNILNFVRSIKYPICEMVEKTVYNYIDAEGNFVDESKASKIDLHILKQYPYSFDDFLNPNLEMLNVFKYSTKK